VIAIAAAAAGIGAGPGFLFGLVGPALQQDLGISRSDLGLLIGLFFGGTGAASIAAGRWSSRLGARGCILLDLCVLTVCMVAISALQTYPVLVAGAVVSGMAYAFGNVGTTMAVVQVARRGTVGMALTLRTAGVPTLATALAAASGAVGSRWHLIAWSLAGAAAVLALLAFRVLPTAVTTTLKPAPEPPAHRRFWLLPLAAFLFIGGSQPLQSWTVTYLHDDARVPMSQAGPVVALGTLAGTVVMIAVALGADRSGPARRAVLAAAVAAVCAVGILLTLAATPWWLPLGVLGIAVGIAANLSGAGLTHTVAAERSGESVGRGSGMMSSGYYLGALIAPWGFGELADLTGGYTLPWLVCAGLMLLSGAVFLRVQAEVPVRLGALGAKSPQPR
jgi:predicted MFS family arabinose efflux permease